MEIQILHNKIWIYFQLDIYFRTATKYFQIRYVTPYTSFNLETVLFGAPNYMEDEGSLNRTAYPYSITMT